MAGRESLTVLCLASYFKGPEFLKECKRLGHRVLLITSQRFSDHPWPKESIDVISYASEKEGKWDLEALVRGVSHLARQEQIDRIVPLDDFDLEKAALLREHFRMRGMGESQTRFFRDKLAMRVQARHSGIRVPDFTGLFHDRAIRAFCEETPPPWLIKPRSQASATGIRKVNSEAELWDALEDRADERSFYLAERYLPGSIYHVDSVVTDGEVVFARVHVYLDPPMKVAHEGGIFTSVTVPYGCRNETVVQQLNGQLLQAMGLRRGVTHTEFILADEDGEFYFMETAARVGGAHIAEMLEASSGLNLWAEWARLELLDKGEAYALPEVSSDYSGIIITLARQQWPDTSAYDDPEIVWRLDRPHHAGLIVKSDTAQRVQDLLEQYKTRFFNDFHASEPLPDKPSA